MAQRIDSPDMVPRASGRRSGEEPIEVRRHLDAIRRSRWLIAAIVGLLTLVVVAVSASLPDRYKATASIVKNVTTDPLASTDVNVVTRELATTDRLITTTDTLAAAARQVPGETERSLQDNVSSTVDPDANLIFVTATAGTAGGAARIANAVAETFVNAQAELERRQLNAARAGLLAEEARLRGQPDATAQRQAIEQRLSELGVSLAAAGTDLAIAERATPPDSPASPKPLRNGIIAAFLGLFIGILVALGRDQLVPRLSSQRELSRLIDLPLLASVPYVNRRFGLRPRLPSGIEYETYQSLAASLRFALPPGDEPRLVLVTSALHAEGKSTVSARLGEALAQSGQPTLLISADLRWPTLHEILDTPLAPGLTDILQSIEPDTPPAEVRRQLTEMTVSVHEQSRRGTLHVLPSGNQVDEPARLLSGPGMDAVADALLELDYGYVLVDSAPILGIADSLVLARALHHVLFVARLDRLTLDTVYDVREVLDRLETEPIGMVVLGARGEASPYYLTAARPALDES